MQMNTLPKPASPQRHSTQRPGMVLASVSAARYVLPGLDENAILALVEDGQLLYAWNLGLGAARDMRIYPPCLVHYARTAGARPFPDTEDEVSAALLGTLHVTTSTAWVTGRMLSLLFNCSSTQIINMLDARLLKLLPGTGWKTGPNGSPHITADSLKQFLISRRLP